MIVRRAAVHVAETDESTTYGVTILDHADDHAHDSPACPGYERVAFDPYATRRRRNAERS